MNDYSKLKRLAEAATAGPWVSSGNWVSTVRGNSVADCPRGDEEFIAAANPAVVLALIAENEKLFARDVEHVRQFNELSDFRQKTVEAFDVKVAALESENKRLAALLECAQGDLRQAMQIIERQTAERQEWQKVLKMTEIPREGDQSKYSLALKDAERYRWLRDPDHCQEDFLDGPADNIVVGSCGGEDILWAEQLDAAVDAAMSKEG